MNDDKARQKLTETLRPELSEWVSFIAGDGHRSIGQRERPQSAEEIAGALLPTVRALIADELEETAQQFDWRTQIKLRDRAATLREGVDHP